MYISVNSQLRKTHCEKLMNCVRPAPILPAGKYFKRAASSLASKAIPTQLKNFTISAFRSLVPTMICSWSPLRCSIWVLSRSRKGASMKL